LAFSPDRAGQVPKTSQRPVRAAAQVSKAVGVIKSIQADSITIVAESGGEVTATS
jgi:hypothetical protein